MSRVSHQPIQRPQGKAPVQQGSSPIVLLKDADFKAVQLQKGHLVYNTLPGISFVFFGSNKCKFCPGVMEVMKALPAYLGKACTTAIVNMDEAKSLRELSKGTPFEIKYVPFLVIYNNGAPVNVYNGEKKLLNIVNYLRDIIPKIKAAMPTPFVKTAKKTEDNDLGLPYNVYCDDEMCYLTDGEMTNGKEDCEDGQCCFLSDREL